MISVISSYRIPRSSTGDALSELESVCAELRANLFGSVDVLVTSADVASGLGGADARLEGEAVMAVASAIAARIHSALHAGGELLRAPALATNLPNISDISGRASAPGDLTLHGRAVFDLAVSWAVADRVGARVVEAVCGRRVAAPAGAPPASSLGSIRAIESRLASGIEAAYAMARDALGRPPRAGLALEVEPDELALAMDFTELSRIVGAMVRAWRAAGHHGLADRVGFCLDVGHCILQLDRRAPHNGSVPRAERIEKLCELLRSPDVHGRLFHAHASDHAPGAHWTDAPVGSFHPLSEFAALLDTYRELWPADEKESFHTRKVAIELEACDDVAQVVASRDALVSGCGLRMHEEGDLLERVIARTSATHLERGWHEGIDGALLHAVWDIHSHGKACSCGEPLFTDGLVATIDAFLRARSPESKTSEALAVAEQCMRWLGAEALAMWFAELSVAEYGRVFHDAYRDHTIHSVNVFLLGWLFYARCAEARQRVQSGSSELRQPCSCHWFPLTWTLASLAHDVGYLFEAGDASVTRRCLASLSGHGRDYVSEVIPYVHVAPNVKLGDRARDLIALAIRPGGPPSWSSVEDLIGDAYHAALRQCPKLTKHAHLDAGDIETIYRLLSNEQFPPDAGRVPESRRRSFADHGIAGAALVWAVLDCGSWWARWLASADCPPGRLHQAVLTEEERTALLESGAPPPPPSRLDVCGLSLDERAAIRAWMDEVRRRARRPAFAEAEQTGHCTTTRVPERWTQEACAAIALHNLVPEYYVEPYADGVLYTSSTLHKSPAGDVLRKMRQTSVEDPLGVLLGLCDALQDWGRQAFAHPMRSGRSVMPPSAVSVRWHADGGGPVVFSYPTCPGRADERRAELAYRYGAPDDLRVGGWGRILGFC